MNIHDIYKYFMAPFRRKRMSLFKEVMGVTDGASIIDIGGTPMIWGCLDVKPAVTLVNINADEWHVGNMRMISASGTEVPFPDNSFDICFSNSVIEHVGGKTEQEKFASEVRRLSKRYWVQTPNKWFFVEPHLIGVFIHWMPARYSKYLVRWFTVWGWVNKPTLRQADDFIRSINLLSISRMRVLFPDADIIQERVAFFLVKSIIACKKN